MDLGGKWLAAGSDDDLRRAFADTDFDDSRWDQLDVPGHWRSHPAFASSDGPVLYRRHFTSDPPRPDRRTFLTFDGIFYQGDVWLDGEYLGDTEGYFFPHTFEVTDACAARSDHALAVEVACSRPSDLRAKRNLTGVFQHWDCIDPDWNPGGIWAPIRIEETGPVRIRSVKVLCRDATEDVATLDLEAELDTLSPCTVTVRTTAGRQRPHAGADNQIERVDEHNLAASVNRVRWRLTVERPELWWPHSLGPQPLYQVEVAVQVADSVSDRRVLTTGLRQIRVRNFVATVNGERLFLKGANCGPTRRALAEASCTELEGDVVLARAAGLDLLRVHAHITRPEFYEAADRDGMLIWQDLPLQWGYGQVRRQAVRQARQAVSLLGHHPSVALWCGHNEPLALELTPNTAGTPRTMARFFAGQVLPSWNKTALDRSIRRALERADGSREVVAHSGILPHPAWGTDSHLYFGWYYGHQRELSTALARLPVLARFVSEFGAQAVPESAEFLDLNAGRTSTGMSCRLTMPCSWLSSRSGVPPAQSPTFEAWRSATQAYQATLLRHHIETLRLLKYRPTGGFCLFLLADSQPAVSWSILDHHRLPKAGYHAVTAASAPVIITAERPQPTYRPGDRLLLDLHAVSDLRRPVSDALARAVVRWPGGAKVWKFSGDLPADSCVRIGRIDFTVPLGTEPGPLALELDLRWEDGHASNAYLSQLAAPGTPGQGRRRRGPRDRRGLAPAR